MSRKIIVRILLVVLGVPAIIAAFLCVPLLLEVHHEDQMPPHIVRAVKEIHMGEDIPTDSLEDQVVEPTKIPKDAIKARTLAAGRVAKHAISVGQIIYDRDLCSDEDLKEMEKKGWRPGMTPGSWPKSTTKNGR